MIKEERRYSKEEVAEAQLGVDDIFGRGLLILAILYLLRYVLGYVIAQLK
jgi:hypothetical protein